MPSVGYATIQIIPSVRGISDEIRRQLTGPAGAAGGAAGQESGTRFAEKWKAGLAVAGAAAGAILAAATVSAVEKERVGDRLSAQLGLSGKGAKQAGKVAGDLYSRAVVDSFEDGAAAVRAVMSSGLIPEGATTKAIEGITTKVADLAGTFDQDLTGTANAAAQMIRTGLAKDGAQALDLLTVGFQGSADKAGDFLDTVNEYGVQFQKAGLDGASAIGLLNQAIAAGARDSDVAADAIKEFSIRAVDGSQTTSDGFKMLGLNADDMAAKFAKGGSAANGVLDLTLDKLRGIKDPVKQSQAAVALFGTQAEDLGQALYAMDPSSAASGLGKVGGAAKQVGDTIRGNTSTELKVLQRQFMSVLGSVVNSIVLPALRGLNDAVKWVGDAAAATGRWFQEWGAWLIPAALLVGGLTIALNAQAIATGLVTAVFAVYRGAILAGTAVTQGFAAAQALLNSVMALNPITLIVIALVALGAALVVAWKKSETFRQIVTAAWRGIQTAALYVWNNVLKPAFEGIKTALSAVGQAFQWLWASVIKPVFGFINTAARVLLTLFTIVVFGPIYLQVKIMGAVFSWLWRNAIKPAFGFITAGAKLLWAGMKAIFDYFMAGLKTVGGWFKWLYNVAVKPVFNAVVAVGKLAWAGIKTVFNWFMAGLKTVGGWFKWLYDKGVKPAFNSIKSVISTVWNSGIKPVFDKLRAATGKVADAFKVAKDGIKKAWDKIKGIAKTPVAFIIDTVYNGGIVKVWNAVAGKFGAPKLDRIKGFATGGVLPGYTPGRDVHLAALSGGEAVMRPEWTRAVGSGYVHRMNAAARSGGVAGVQRALGLPAFADGGIFGWVRNTASKGVDLVKGGFDWLKDGIKASAVAGLNKIVKPLIDKIAGSASVYRDMISGVPKRMIKAIVSFSGQADKRMEALGIGGGTYKSAQSFARAQSGKPYIWGGVGPTGYDCSGFMSAIENVIRGVRPYSRRWATMAFSGSQAPSGWVRNRKSPFMVGITNAGVGHTAGTLNGVNVESRGGDGVVVGRRARGHKSSLFTDWYGLKYDSGGWLKPGQVGVNHLGEPEAVLTPAQSTAFVQLAAAAARMAAQPAQVRESSRGANFADLQVSVYVGDQQITDIARAEVRTAQGELIQVLNAG